MQFIPQEVMEVSCFSSNTHGVYVYTLLYKLQSIA